MLAKRKNVSRVAVTSKSPMFIPDADDWARFYRKWFGKIAWLLRRQASKETVEDGVEEAFLKLQGLSSERHLEQALQPLTEKAWFRYILQQAEWIISHERDRNSRWDTDARTIDEVNTKIRAIGEDRQLTPLQRESALRNHRQLLGCLVELEESEESVRLPCDRLDGDLMARKLQALMDEMRARHGISAKCSRRTGGTYWTRSLRQRWSWPYGAPPIPKRRSPPGRTISSR